jgi:hypothetical protein
MQDAELVEVSTTASDAATLEARCLEHPRTRREMAKPALRAAARARCEQRADAF